MRVRLEQVRLPANVTAGMNVLVVCSLAYMMRGTLDDPPPVLVRADGPDRWHLLDGRHRLVAAMIAGRPDILANVE